MERSAPFSCRAFYGWTLDAFDFFVLVFVVEAIADDFHTEAKAVTRPAADREVLGALPGCGVQPMRCDRRWVAHQAITLDDAVRYAFDEQAARDS